MLQVCNRFVRVVREKGQDSVYKLVTFEGSFRSNPFNLLESWFSTDLQPTHRSVLGTGVLFSGLDFLFSFFGFMNNLSIVNANTKFGFIDNSQSHSVPFAFVFPLHCS